MRVLSPILQALFVAAVAFALLDAAIDRTFPHFDRLRFNFSAPYLAREFAALAPQRPVVVLGDSVLWGYHLPADRAAVSLIRRTHPDWVNLAFPGGSPVNTLAMLELLLHARVHPRLIVFNVNQKTFDIADSSYDKLYPSVESLAWPILTEEERATMTPSLKTTLDARLDRGVGRIWHFYGMRADVRDALFDESDVAHRIDEFVEAHTGAGAARAEASRPTADKFAAAYDLEPLTTENTSYRALLLLARLLRTNHIPAIAILTPTNHTLLHEFLDDPGYAADLKTTRAALDAQGLRVIDLDDAFPANEFIDNDHLTEAGNARLARIIAVAAGARP